MKESKFERTVTSATLNILEDSSFILTELCKKSAKFMLKIIEICDTNYKGVLTIIFTVLLIFLAISGDLPVEKLVNLIFSKV